MTRALKQRQVARDVTEDSFAPLPGVSSCTVSSATVGRGRHRIDAGQGEEPGRAALRLRKQTTAVSTPLAPAACVDYVVVDRIVEVCGIDSHTLHFRYRPRDWGIPGHWLWRAGKTFYKISKLPELAREMAPERPAEAAKILALFEELGGLEAHPSTPWYQRGALA